MRELFFIVLGWCLCLIYMTYTKPAQPEALPCPNGAIGQVLHADGTTYCSYMSGRYKAQVKWKEI